jgi:ubiquitin C-terminal hydrolase
MVVQDISVRLDADTTL